MQHQARGESLQRELAGEKDLLRQVPDDLGAAVETHATPSRGNHSKENSLSPGTTMRLFASSARP